MKKKSNNIEESETVTSAAGQNDGCTIPQEVQTPSDIKQIKPAKRRFKTSLRDFVRQKIESLDRADIVVGIPSYDSDRTIVNVIKMIKKGLETYYPNLRALIIVSDGGSTDDTRENAKEYDVKSFNIDKIVTIYRGLPGKGSALRCVFESADFLDPRAVAVFDSDLLSITPHWIKSIIDPVYSGYDFIAPDYQRYKFDATITNTIAYNLVRALYGMRIRQPIGGDFGMSIKFVRHLLSQKDIWETDIARFGIDIWTTVSAIVGGFRICQASLGAKIHGEKDPSADLGPMFRQVVGTLFSLMEHHESFWKNVKCSFDVPTVGDPVQEEPKEFLIDQDSLIEYFKVGFWNFGTVWKQILDPQDVDIIKNLAHEEKMDKFIMPTETWVRTVYRYAAAFRSTPRQRMKILDTMLPLYNARVASLANELKDLGSEQAEGFFQKNGEIFEQMKGYLIENWK